MLLNPMDLTGKVILVTGASSGIGRDTCILLSQLGAKVILVGRNIERLEKTLSQMESNNHKIEYFDLREVDEIPNWLKKITANLEPLDGLVHSAGIAPTMPIRFTTLKHLNNTLTTNLSSSIFLAKALRQKGCHKAQSSLVFLSSAAGLVGVESLAEYSATKGALISMARSLAVELVKDGIRVNCVAPGFVKSEMSEQYQEISSPERFAQMEASYLLGMGTTRDIAHAIGFLLADTGKWITGTTLSVDGGCTAI
jgi:NAD(P)-dependent dehydrogenase (short-subunit alcohol dehydrogenase family)